MSFALFCCFILQSTIFQPYMWRIIDVQVDRKRTGNKYLVEFLNVPVQALTQDRPSERPKPLYRAVEFELTT